MKKGKERHGWLELQAFRRHYRLRCNRQWEQRLCRIFFKKMLLKMECGGKHTGGIRQVFWKAAIMTYQKYAVTSLEPTLPMGISVTMASWNPHMETIIDLFILDLFCLKSRRCQQTLDKERVGDIKQSRWFLPFKRKEIKEKETALVCLIYILCLSKTMYTVGSFLHSQLYQTAFLFIISSWE